MALTVYGDSTAPLTLLSDAAKDKRRTLLLEEVVVGWDNIAEPFSIAGISDQYTLPEVMAILDGIPMAMVPGVEDKKK